MTKMTNFSPITLLFQELPTEELSTKTKKTHQEVAMPLESSPSDSARGRPPPVIIHPSNQNTLCHQQSPIIQRNTTTNTTTTTITTQVPTSSSMYTFTAVPIQPAKLPLPPSRPFSLSSKSISKPVHKKKRRVPLIAPALPPHLAHGVSKNTQPSLHSSSTVSISPHYVQQVIPPFQQQQQQQRQQQEEEQHSHYFHQRQYQQHGYYTIHTDSECEKLHLLSLRQAIQRRETEVKESISKLIEISVMLNNKENECKILLEKSRNLKKHKPRKCKVSNVSTKYQSTNCQGTHHQECMEDNSSRQSQKTSSSAEQDEQSCKIPLQVKEHAVSMWCKKTRNCIGCNGAFATLIKTDMVKVKDMFIFDLLPPKLLPYSDIALQSVFNSKAKNVGTRTLFRVGKYTQENGVIAVRVIVNIEEDFIWVQSEVVDELVDEYSIDGQVIPMKKRSHSPLSFIPPAESLYKFLEELHRVSEMKQDKSVFSLFS